MDMLTILLVSVLSILFGVFGVPWLSRVPRTWRFGADVRAMAERTGHKTNVFQHILFVINNAHQIDEISFIEANGERVERT